jgi:thermostable 8-oxoguanine DNA glycosylase
MKCHSCAHVYKVINVRQHTILSLIAGIEGLNWKAAMHRVADIKKLANETLADIAVIDKPLTEAILRQEYEKKYTEKV